MATKYKQDAASVHKFANRLPGLRALDPADGQPQLGVSMSEDVEVRQLRLSDCAALGTFTRRYELRHPESDSDRPGRLRLMSQRLVSGDHTRQPLYIARDITTDQRLGMLQCVQQGVDDRWFLQYLASQEEVDHENTVHIALLEHAVGQAGWRGARRIMARSNFESPVTGTLRSVGFSPFARELVYALPAVPAGSRRNNVQVQEKSDVWSIHQLYLRTTPQDVQNAEALTSHVWDIDYEGRSRRGWLVTTDNDTSAFVRVRTTRKYHLLEAMFLPDSLACMEDLFLTVFWNLRSESPRPVYVLVRGYQQELDLLMDSFGFGPESDELMMVRYTTVAAPASVRPLEAFERLRTAEPNARRVPSFSVRDVHE